MRLDRAVTCALVLLLAGCASAPLTDPPPLLAPRVTTSVRHGAGSPLGGSSGQHLDPGEPEHALQVVVTFFALERLADDQLEPLASHTRLVVSPSEDRPLLSASRLGNGARTGLVKSAPELLARIRAGGLGGRAAFLAELRGALPVGATATFEAVRDGTRCDLSCEPVHERVAVHAFRVPGEEGQDDVEVTLELEDTHVPGDLSRARPRPERELSIVEPRLGPGSVLALLVPSPFGNEEARAIAAVVSVLAPPEAPELARNQDAFAACQADLARQEVLVRVRARIPAEHLPTLPDVAGARAALAKPAERRASLLRIARACGAHLAEDVALSGDDGLVAGVAKRLLLLLEQPKTGLDRAAIAWLVEREAMAAMREHLTPDEAPAEVTVLVLERGGGAGRSLATFFALADASTSLADFEGRLAAENLELLEDASPALRSRAHEWLLARRRAPPGYDPLAPAAERRLALDRFLASPKPTPSSGGAP